jgi:GNAT superfamily N-acetyltransferase
MGQVVALLSAAAGPISAPEKLDGKHILAGFNSGEPVLDDWLTRRALANEGRGASRTYVVCEQNVVIGYYSLAAGTVAHEEAISRVRRNMPDPIPVMLLGRLAVRLERAGKGIGPGLLADAMYRTVQAADIAGMAALLVHALHERAAGFYLKHGFSQSPTGPLTLMLSLKDILANIPR